MINHTKQFHKRCMVIVMTASLLFSGACPGTGITAYGKSAKIKKLKQTSAALDRVSLQWKKVKGAKQYQVQIKIGKKYKSSKTKKTRITLKKLNAGTTYKVRVRYKKKKKYSSWTKINVSTLPAGSGSQGGGNTAGNTPGAPTAVPKPTMKPVKTANDGAYNGAPGISPDYDTAQAEQWEKPASSEDNGLLYDIKVVDNKVMDLVSGKEVVNLTPCQDKPGYFTGVFDADNTSRDKGEIEKTWIRLQNEDETTTKVATPGDNWDITYEAVIDYDEAFLDEKHPVFYAYNDWWIENYSPISAFSLTTNSGKHHLRLNRLAQDPYESHWIPFDANYLRADGNYAYENIPSGDTFVAVSGDYTNKITTARFDGTSVNFDMEMKTEAYKYYRYYWCGFRFTNYHRVKEFKIYKGAKSAEDLKYDYSKTNIAKTTTETKTGSDGIVGLGSCFAWQVDKNNNAVFTDLSNKKAGVYEITDNSGNKKMIGIADYEDEPTLSYDQARTPHTTIDNSIYDSVHITNKRDTMYVGKQYPLSAFPYPLVLKDDNTTPDYDIAWTSDNPDVVAVYSGLMIAKKAGTATITASLRGTDKKDSFTILVKDAPKLGDKTYIVPADLRINYLDKSRGGAYKENGCTFATAANTTSAKQKACLKAIFAAIDYAAENGYTKIVFPKLKYYAMMYNTGLHYYVPSNIEIVFPEGSELHMLFPVGLEHSASDPTKCEFHTFEFGVNSYGDGAKCENSKLYIDKYFGERYEEYRSKGKVDENKYIEEYRFAEFGRRAYNCSVTIKHAEHAAGYFITADGTTYDNYYEDVTDDQGGKPKKRTGVIRYDNMVSGKISSTTGDITPSELWYSTSEMIDIPEKCKQDGFFMAGASDREWYGTRSDTIEGLLYDIHWYNEDKKLIRSEAFHSMGEYYSVPEGAEYYKFSIHMKKLPTAADKLRGTSDSTAKNSYGDAPADLWLQMYDNGAATDCEITGVNTLHSATGLFSVVGETDGLWIHHNYIPANGEMPMDARLGDFEDGWESMRHSVVSNNIMAKGEYAGGGPNTFMHTNYFGNEVYTKALDENDHVINSRCLAFLIQDRYVTEFSYNHTRGYIWNDRAGWGCKGNLHFKYRRWV